MIDPPPTHISGPTLKRNRSFIQAYYFHKATKRQCKTIGFEPARIVLKLGDFFQKMTRYVMIVGQK